MTYADAIQFLYNLRFFGAKFGLENTLRLAELAGNPQHGLSFIHVAGTNGKGSTCAMLESIYRTAGLRVGLFTSPHLVAFGERIQVNRQMISQAEVIDLVLRMRQLITHFPHSAPPTFFEVITIMALVHFARHECDLVIWETGLGGRLDATNIVTPLASVITNVQLDHQQWLGNTLPEIAAEKAGIIKRGVPVVTSADGDALGVIAEKARSLSSPLIRVGIGDIQKPPLAGLQLPLLGDHQRINATLACATVNTLAAQVPVAGTDLHDGLLKVEWPGRMQLVDRGHQRLLVLDGAHNPAGAATLKAACERHFPGVKPALILGVLKDKDWQGICHTLAPLASRILLTVVHSERTTLPETLSRDCQTANPGVQVIPCGSVAEALARTQTETFTLLSGSLYLVGEAMELLDLGNRPPREERGLNEWTGSGTASNRSLLRTT